MATLDFDKQPNRPQVEPKLTKAERFAAAIQRMHEIEYALDRLAGHITGTDSPVPEDTNTLSVPLSELLADGPGTLDNIRERCMLSINEITDLL